MKKEYDDAAIKAIKTVEDAIAAFKALCRSLGNAMPSKTGEKFDPEALFPEHREFRLRWLSLQEKIVELRLPESLESAGSTGEELRALEQVGTQLLAICSAMDDLVEAVVKTPVSFLGQSWTLRELSDPRGEWMAVSTPATWMGRASGIALVNLSMSDPRVLDLDLDELETSDFFFQPEMGN